MQMVIFYSTQRSDLDIESLTKHVPNAKEIREFADQEHMLSFLQLPHMLKQSSKKKKRCRAIS